MKAVLITSSILIVLIAALRPLLRGRLDPRVQYALWLVAALRLLIPVNLVTSAYSALALLDRAEEPPQIIESIGQTAIPVRSYDSARTQVIEDYRRQGMEEAALTPGDLMAIDTQAKELMRGPTVAELARRLARPVWLGGAAVMAVWFLLVNLRLHRRLRDAEYVEVDCPLPVYVSGALPSPCLCGTVRPAIYVTPAALESPGRLRHVLAHELTHYRHRDHWWALVRCLCLCAYWFDPLVWLAAALSRQDCELACDEGAIRRLGEEERLPYGRTLVDMIAAGRTPLLQTATTMTGGKRRVRERIKLIARRPQTVIAAALVLVVVLVLAVGCTFTGAPKDGKPMSATVDSLRERLLEVPEDLRPTVEASASETKAGFNDIALAAYWWDGASAPESQNVPTPAWLLSVHRWDRGSIDVRGWASDSDDKVREIIAQDEECYYTIERPVDIRFDMEDGEGFNTVYQAIRAYAMQTVLATEGVEPFRHPLDTLRERLNNVPRELQADVVTGAGHDDSPILATYWMNRDWTNLDNSGLGYLLRVEELSLAQLDAYRNTGSEGFAKRGDTYYAITYATDVRYYTVEDAEPYHNAFDAIRAYAMQTVLSTEGVEPFDPDNRDLQPLSTLQDRLLDIPEELKGSVVNRPADAGPDGESNVLVDYWLDGADWEMGMGWVLGVSRLDRAEFEEYLYTIPTGNVQIFAQGNGYYYAIHRPTDARWGQEDAERYSSARQTLLDFAMQQVLSTEGVLAFDEEEQRSRVQFEGKTYTQVAYWPYKAVNGSTDVVWICHLVQPAKDGPDGVWVPERMDYCDPDFPYQSYLIRPDTGGLTVAEYANQLQAEADAGRAAWATDPIEVLRRYEQETGGRADIPLDSFTRDAAYIENVLAGTLPTPEQEAIQAVMDEIINAPVINAALSLDHKGYIYQTTAPSGYWARQLNAFATDFEWEELTGQIPEETLKEMETGGGLNLSVPNGPTLIVHETANIAAISTGPDSGVTLYQAKSKVEGETIGDVYFLYPGPYETLRYWFDEVQLYALRTTSVPDRGQSHEDVVLEWIDGFEGVYTKCAPGSLYACTYVRPIGVTYNQPNWISPQELDYWAERIGYDSADFGKTWFGFSYSLVFVPENENAKQHFLAGNTTDYPDEAPEGAQIFSRVGYMELIDGNWVCERTNTGW